MGFDFADFSAIQLTLEEMYSVEGGQLFTNRAGNAIFRQALSRYGALQGGMNPAFRSMPLRMQLLFGLQALARSMTHVSDQIITVEESETKRIHIIQRCPHCGGRSQVTKPIRSFWQDYWRKG